MLRRGELSTPGRDLAAREAEERGGSGRQSPQACPRKERGERLPRRCVWRRGSEAQEWNAPVCRGTRGDTRACGNFWGVCLENRNACVRCVCGEARVGGVSAWGGAWVVEVHACGVRECRRV